MLAVKVEQFEGPLDVLLSLIQEEKLDITTVSLASVADQYLEHLGSFASGLRTDELADFLVVGSKLLYIKSKFLLPYLTKEDEQEIQDLACQLKIYKEFLTASKVLQKILARKRVSYIRPFSLTGGSDEHFFLPPKKLSLKTLRDAFYTLITKVEAQKPSVKITFNAGITVQEKIAFLRELSMPGQVSFFTVLRESRTLTEIIVSFLALLELVKQRHFIVMQDVLFGDIIITRKAV